MKPRNLSKVVKHLRDIASGSPGVVQPGTPSERPCALCLAHINHAREALGFEKWPAVPATEKDKA